MAIVIDIKVIPSSGRQNFFTDKSGKLKCYLKNPPEKGKANEEVLKLISKKLRLSRECVKLMRGSRTTKKRIKIETDSEAKQVISILAGEN